VVIARACAKQYLSITQLKYVLSAFKCPLYKRAERRPFVWVEALFGRLGVVGPLRGFSLKFTKNIQPPGVHVFSN
jgi:hypothetical protein